MRDAAARRPGEGACGMSTGLIYPPCCYADTAELVALGRVLAEAGRPLVVHMRSESDRILEAVAEMVRVARASRAAPCTSRTSRSPAARTGASAGAVVALLGGGARRGLRITADQYPYVAGSTLLGAILPPWAHDGGDRGHAGPPARSASARAPARAAGGPGARATGTTSGSGAGPEGIVIADIPSGRHPGVAGQDAGAGRGRARARTPFEAAFDLLLEERLGVAMVSFSQDEAVVERFLPLPFVNVCTDGLLGGRPHPRAYGTYPRILGRYVRERRDA